MKSIPDEEQRNLHDDYQRRRVPVRPAQAIKNVLGQLLAKRGYAQVQTASSCEAAWREAVGSRFQKDSRPGGVRRGVLEVTVRNSSIVQELTFVKVQLIKKLTSLVPDQKIKDLKFRVGSLD